MGKGIKSRDRKCGLVFDKRQTNIAKGAALILLLWHHLFYQSPRYYSRFISAAVIDGVPIESLISNFCKVCVAVFLLLSGYGLTKSFAKYSACNSVNNKLPFKKTASYIGKRYIKLYSDFWAVFLIFVPMGAFFGRFFLDIYNGHLSIMLLDFFGLTHLFFGYELTMNATWWFMSVIVIMYLFFPLLYKLMNYSAELLLALSVLLLVSTLLFTIPYIAEYIIWLAPFVFGMYISKYDGFDVLSRKLNTVPKRLFVSLAAIVTFGILRFAGKHTLIYDSLFAFSIILFCFFILSRIPILNKILEQLGRYSGLIFMFHTFIFDLYFMNFIYWFKYPLLILIVLTAVCYLVALALDFIKKLCGKFKQFIIKQAEIN